MTSQSVDPRTGEPFGPVLPDTDDATYEAVLGAAADAELAWAATGGDGRAAGLRAAADALDEAAGSLVPLADRESGLGATRLAGELARTTFQLRMFAGLAADGSYLDDVVDPADDR